MAILEEILGDEMLAEMGLGIGLVVLAPRMLRPVLRPAAKELIKGGLRLYRGARAVIGEATAATADAAPSPPPRLHASPARAGAKPKAPPRRRRPSRTR